MSDLAIRVENLGKAYRISHQRERGRYKTLQEDLLAALRWPGRRLRGAAGSEGEKFWALRDLSFDVREGEVLGIIGRNGAGKSTLLKILSRITEPTTGYADVYGRVGSLLEVGTGFHPELTGRENIFLNGAILGMTQREIQRRFDEIVAFAEVEQFLDTPVKRYSSGMYVRLAFAVAAHLEPEILVVDEVLAVGDAEFQRKCLGKMGDVARAGRTVLFVSHQMDMVRALCDRCLLLSRGQVRADGSPEAVIEAYTNSADSRSQSASFSVDDDEGMAIQIVRGQLVDGAGQPRSSFDVFEPMFLQLEYVVRRATPGAIVNFEMKRNGATLFFSFDADNEPTRLESRQPGHYKSRVAIPCPLLKPGHYSLTLGTGIVNVAKVQHLEDVLEFEVELLSKPSTFLSYAAKRPGVIAVPLDWETEVVDRRRPTTDDRRLPMATD